MSSVEKKIVFFSLGLPLSPTVKDPKKNLHLRYGIYKAKVTQHIDFSIISKARSMEQISREVRMLILIHLLFTKQVHHRILMNISTCLRIKTREPKDKEA